MPVKMKNIKNKFKNGFSIIELIIAGTISLTAIGVGYSLLEIGIRGNKIDETQMGLNGRINDTLDFILDEVKASKRIIDIESEITQYNPDCVLPSKGDFLFGIYLPDQALAKSDYKTDGDQLTLNQVECPIIYSLRKSLDTNKSSYTLLRYGPQFNSIGYYISPSFIEFKETILLDGITNSTNYKKITCPYGWNDIKTIKGISFCIDQFKKAIEIQIEAIDTQKGLKNNVIRSIASVGGFSSIQDESQINKSMDASNKIDSFRNCIGNQCCWLGICLTSNKVTYLIDNSFYMNKDYLHFNGVIINGSWQPIFNPELISPRINGKSLIEYVTSSLKQHINKLPTSFGDSDENKIYIQIIANNTSSNYLFKEGPQELTTNNKIAALKYLDNLQAEEEFNIDPWDDICKSIESEYIGQLIIISTWKPETILASRNQSCIGKSNGEISEIISDYNQFIRSKSATGALTIDGISLFHNYCEKSKNFFKNEWLGKLTRSTESSCIHIK